MYQIVIAIGSRSSSSMSSGFCILCGRQPNGSMSNASPPESPAFTLSRASCASVASRCFWLCHS